MALLIRKTLFALLLAATAAGGSLAATPTGGDKAAQGGNYNYFFLEAMLQREKGNRDAAFDLLRYCLQLKPDAPEAYFYLAQYYLAMNDKERSTHCFEKAAELSPGNATYLETLAQAYATSNKTKEAIGVLERLAAAVKLVIVLALFHITGPCAFKHVPLRFELPFAGQFQILLPFRFAFPLPVNLRRLLRNGFRRPEHAGYPAHNLTEQTDRMLFHFKTGMLVVKPFPVLPHPAKRRGIVQYGFYFSHRSFSASSHILIAEVRKQFRFPLPDRF